MTVYRPTPSYFHLGRFVVILTGAVATCFSGVFSGRGRKQASLSLGRTSWNGSRLSGVLKSRVVRCHIIQYLAIVSGVCNMSVGLEGVS